MAETDEAERGTMLMEPPAAAAKADASPTDSPRRLGSPLELGSPPRSTSSSSRGSGIPQQGGRQLKHPDPDALTDALLSPACAPGGVANGAANYPAPSLGRPFGLTASTARSPETPPHGPEKRPPSSPLSPRSSLMEQHLQAAHWRDQAAIADAFHARPQDPARSYVVNTVSPEEGHFLAAYLGLPERNVLKVKCGDFREGNHVHRALREAIASYFAGREEDLAAVTFLGHMELDKQGTLKFARLHADALFDLISDLRPRALNFFSCSSVTYAEQIADRFVAQGAPVPRMTCFADDVEVSQWPKRGSPHKPLRMFYAGPEIGRYTPSFSPQLHSFVLPHVRQLYVRGAEYGTAADDTFPIDLSHTTSPVVEVLQP